MKINPFIFLLVSFFCHSIYAKKITPSEYIETYKADAVKEMNRSGVPASITLAQGMLESGYGNSELAKNANNHFGIKCHSSWTGDIYRLDDDKKNECFRKYKTVWQSYRDHSNFLKGSKRYASLFNLKLTDYKGWCKGLKNAGYATNKRYAVLLIDMIERYDLNRFVTQEKLKIKQKNKKKGSFHKKTNQELKKQTNKFNYEVKISSNWIKYIEVKKGDTYYSISKRFNISLSRLFSYNDCNSDTTLQIGSAVYLQPKRSRGTQKIYFAKAGDCPYRISQQFGIKLKHLYRRNNWTEGYTPKEGEKIYLRGKRR
ncbi:MAG: hypothetical protein CMD35_05590 [Flavobacteriales bacterium]|nr:hypothetical protein [Flavobacteriales bacterium]